MSDILKTQTYGVGAKIAETLNITPQGWSSKVRSQPLNTVKETLIALKKLGRARSAWLIIEDFRAFVRAEFEAESFRKFTIVEIVDKLQTVVRCEISSCSRVETLEAWHELILVASFRIRAISEELETERNSDYGIARSARAATATSQNKFKAFLKRFGITFKEK